MINRPGEQFDHLSPALLTRKSRTSSSRGDQAIRPYLVADPSAARATLNFRPAHSDLATIIRTAWAWHKTAHPLKSG
jgi:UDP-glucose 4-epimerase